MGGLRASAQLISYEITMGLTVIIAIMLVDAGGGVGTLSLRKFVEAQSGSFLDWTIFRFPFPLGLFAFGLFWISAFAETNRLPFDMPEAEPELIGGYHTEYTGMRFALFFMGEYLAMVVQSSVLVTLFLGGWSLPGIVVIDGTWGAALLSVAVFFGKVFIVLFVFLWVRWTLPRFRYDRLMSLGWKVFIPTALLLLVLTAVLVIWRGRG